MSTDLFHVLVLIGLLPVSLWHLNAIVDSAFDEDAPHSVRVLAGLSIGVIGLVMALLFATLPGKSF